MEYQGQTYALKVLVANPEAAERAKREINIMTICDCPRLVKFGPLPLQEIDVSSAKYLYSRTGDLARRIVDESEYRN